MSEEDRRNRDRPRGSVREEGWSSDRFWSLICSFTPFWGMLFILNIIILVLLAFSLWLVEPGTGSYTVALMDTAIVAISMTGLGVLIRKCNSRQRNV